MKHNRLIVFTRNPELGKVKTRLAKSVGDEKALEIYIFLLKHTAKIAANINVEKAVYYSEEILENDLWNPEHFEKKLQSKGDLGERMMHAFEESFKEGCKNAVIIGSDIYDMKSEHIEKAFELLKTHDAVVGPAKDGGYYLLGLKKVHPELFQQKKWGTNTVLRDTLEDLKTNHVALLEELNDVDEYEDIEEHPAFQKFLKD